MKPIQEVFLETEWGDETEAREARDQRITQLEAQGLICTHENLYTVDGYRVFVLEATEADREEFSGTRARKQLGTHPKRGLPNRPTLDGQNSQGRISQV